MSHSTLNDNMKVYGNPSLWSKDEREEMIERALDMYLKAKRQIKIFQASKRQQKLMLPNKTIHQSQSVILMKLQNLAVMKPNLNFIRQENVEFCYFCLKHLTWADNIILIKYIYRFEIRVSCFYQ